MPPSIHPHPHPPPHRVNLFDAAQALRLARKQQQLGGGAAAVGEGDAEEGGVLVVAGDAAPAGFGGFDAVLRDLCGGGGSAALLQPVLTSAAPAGAGPLVLASTSADGTSVADVWTSTQAGAPTAGSTGAPMPLVFYLSGADAAALSDAGTIAAVAAHAGGSADPVTGEPAVVPVEAGVGHLARASRVRGVRIPARFAAGACDGSAPLPLPPLASDDAATIHTRAFARVGVLGNPTDGYGGKTVSLTIANFLAEAWLTPTADGSVELTPHALYDPMRFANAAQLSTIAAREGYSGGVRLMAATVNRFAQHAAARGAPLPSDRGFRLRYHTSIPRQVGLAGSSALVTAMLRAIMAYYGACAQGGTRHRAAADKVFP